MKIPLSSIEEAVESGESIGFCPACGAQQDGCEPDARRYTCEACQSPRVYGAEEIIMMGAFSEEDEPRTQNTALAGWQFRQGHTETHGHFSIPEGMIYGTS